MHQYYLSPQKFAVPSIVGDDGNLHVNLVAMSASHIDFNQIKYIPDTTSVFSLYPRNDESIISNILLNNLVEPNIPYTTFKTIRI